MKGFKKLSTIFISVVVCIFSAIVFAGCDENEKTCKLYVFSTQGGYVLVDNTKEPVEFGDEGSKTFIYNQGSSVKLKAVAESGYDFVKWECTDKLDKTVDLTQEQIEFNISDDEVVIRAKFVLDGTVKYTVSWEQDDNFSIVPLSGYTTEVDLRGDFKFKVTAAEGFDLSNIVVKANGVVLTPNQSGVYTISNIANDVDISVVGVVKDSYKILIDSESLLGLEMILEDGYAYNVNHGEDFKFSVEARDDGYNISKLEVYANGTKLIPDGNGVYVISNITSNVEITFENVVKYQYLISYDQTQGFEITSEQEFVVNYGEDFSFRFELNAGYIAENLKVYANDELLIADGKGIYTVTNVTSNIIISAEGIAKIKYQVIYDTDEGYQIVPESGYSFNVEHGKDFKFKVNIKEGYTANNLMVYANEIKLTPSGSVYTVANVKQMIVITVTGVIADLPDIPDEPDDPETITYTFNLNFTDDVVSQNGDIDFYMPEQVTFTMEKGEGTKSYKAQQYPTAFECIYGEYSSESFAVLIDGLLYELGLGNYILDYFAVNKTGATKVIDFTEDEFTVYWGNLNTANMDIYVILYNTTPNQDVEKPKYKVAYLQSQGFEVIPESGYSFTVEEGGDFKFKIKLDEGYTSNSLGVHVNGNRLTPNQSGVYTITNITSNTSITVHNIEKIKSEISYNQSQGFEIIPESGYSLTVEYGNNFMFKVNIKDGYTASNLVVYANGTKLTPSGTVYTITNIKANITITVSGVTEVEPEIATYTFNLSFTDDIVNQNGDIYFYMPDQVTFTMEKDTGVKPYTSSQYPTAFECMYGEYSSGTFRALISDLLQELGFTNEQGVSIYELDYFAADEAGATKLIDFSDDGFTVYWDNLNAGTMNIYVILSSKTTK